MFKVVSIWLTYFETNSKLENLALWSTYVRHKHETGKVLKLNKRGLE